MLEDLPNKVDNYIFIKYEDLLYNFNETMTKLKEKGITIKKDINFPQNTSMYKLEPNKIFKPTNNLTYKISPEIIISKLTPKYEKLLGYIPK